MIGLIINKYKSARHDVEKVLDANKIRYTHFPDAPYALIVESSKAELSRLYEFTKGMFFVCNVSSLCPVVALDLKPGAQVLDLCAAPGGKTIHIAQYLDPSDQIVANDVSRNRVIKMASLFKEFDIKNILLKNYPGQRFWMKYPNHFDHVLLDAPCTMHGTDSPSDESVKKISKTQKWLLKSAISATRSGGTIVYSTCTTTVEENEEVIDWALQKHKGKIELQSFDCSFLQLDPACAQDSKGNLFEPSIKFAKRIAKTADTEGFFVTKFIKL